MTDAITRLSQSSLGVLMFFGILLFLTLIAVLVFKLLKNRELKAEVAGQKLQLGGTSSKDKPVTQEELIQQTVQLSREEDEDITISKFVFAQLLDSCLEKAMSHSSEITKASVIARADQKEQIHRELTAVVVQMTLEYGQKLKEFNDSKEPEKLTNTELLNFELKKDFKEHVETPTQNAYSLESLKNLSDDDLSNAAVNLTRIALPQLKLSLNRYDILHKEIIYSILEKQESNLTEALKKALREARRISAEYNSNCLKQKSDFRNSILRNVETQTQKDMKDYILTSSKEEEK